MKVLIVLFGLIVWIGSCSDETEALKAGELEADATWVNMLASDGCSWHFAINSKDTTIFLVPSEASLAKIESSIGKMEGYYVITDVHLKYNLTGARKDVLCGWGHTANYDEIEVLEIRKR